MSRIGKKAVPVPGGTKVEITGSHITVTGPKGKLERLVPPEAVLSVAGTTVRVDVADESTRANAMRGLARTLVSNMVIGVNDGFRKRLVIEGVGYKAQENNGVLSLSVGYSNPVDFRLPAGVKATVDKTNAISLESIDKEVLGQTAAKIRAIRPPEPYKGKGIRYENEYVARKVGKAGAKK